MFNFVVRLVFSLRLASQFYTPTKAHRNGVKWFYLLYKPLGARVSMLYFCIFCRKRCCHNDAWLSLVFTGIILACCHSPHMICGYIGGIDRLYWFWCSLADISLVLRLYQSISFSFTLKRNDAVSITNKYYTSFSCVTFFFFFQILVISFDSGWFTLLFSSVIANVCDLCCCVLVLYFWFFSSVEHNSM